jgi:uncharacterized phage infection (PIP) family protein YhgE
MSFICIVCRDLITPVGAVVDNEVVVTKCGHLYHFNCLNEWFNNRDYPRLECPYCKSKVVLAELQRIFPSGDEETDEIVNQYQEAKAQRGANRQLQEEMDDKITQLVDIQAKYEEERLCHDILRFEHTKYVDEVKIKVMAKIQQIKQKAVEDVEALKLQVVEAGQKAEEAEQKAEEAKQKAEEAEQKADKAGKDVEVLKLQVDEIEQKLKAALAEKEILTKLQEQAATTIDSLTIQRDALTRYEKSSI